MNIGATALKMIGVPISIGGKSLNESITKAGTKGAAPTSSKPIATIGTIMIPEISEANVAFSKPFVLSASSGFANKPGISPVRPTPIKSKTGVAGLK
jgi:hypothetical protein